MIGIAFFLESVFLQLKQREHVPTDCIVLSVVRIHKVNFSIRPSSDHTLVHGAQDVQSTAISGAQVFDR